MPEYPLAEIPQGFFSGGGHLTEATALGLRAILNRTRTNLLGRGYFVDPDIADTSFASIEAAIAAGDAERPPGEPLIITVAAGKTHNLPAGGLPLDGSRSVYLVPSAFYFDRGGRPGSANLKWTEIVGNINLQAADSQPNRVLLSMIGIDYSGALSMKSNWKFSFSEGCWQATISRDHGTNGCLVEFNNISNNGTALSIIDTSDSLSLKGSVYVRNAVIFAFVTGAAMWSLRGEQEIILDNVRYSLLGVSDSIFDCNDDDVRFDMSNVHIDAVITVTPIEVFKNHGSATIKWNNTTVEMGPGFTLNLGGSSGTHDNAPRVVADKAPVDPPLGSEWVDTELKDNLVWDGTYWGNLGTYRKDVLVDIGSAALNHDVGWDVPSEGAVVSTSAKLLKALTGAGGAVQVGLGTGSTGDPDKYAETASLASGQKDQNLHGTFNDGGGDDLKVTAETAPGTSGGTVAGSGDEDVRVVVYFKLPKTLP